MYNLLIWNLLYLSNTFALFWNNELQRDEATTLIIEHVEDLCKIFLNWDQLSKVHELHLSEGELWESQRGSNIWFWASSTDSRPADRKGEYTPLISVYFTIQRLMYELFILSLRRNRNNSYGTNKKQRVLSVTTVLSCCCGFYTCI